MGDKSAISWTDTTWNPTTGCTRVSEGCDNCYAYQLHDQRHIAWKRGRMPLAAPQYYKPFSQMQLFPERLDMPLHWSRPRRIFVDSMSDLFHEDVPDEFIDRVFAVMALAWRHTFQVLTKRAERMLRYVGAPGVAARIARVVRTMAVEIGVWGWPLPNVGLGVSVETQEWADKRIPLLLQTPAAVRFISAEPLLGPLSLMGRPIGNEWEWDYLTGLQVWRPDSLQSCLPTRTAGLDWVIVGGESGPHRRPMDLDWARSLRDECVAAGVPFFFKQSSALRPGQGTELDGREWHEFPKGATD